MKNPKQPLKIILIVLTAVAVSGVIGSFVVRRLIEKELSALNLGEMNVSSGGVRVDLLRRTVSLRDVRLSTDVERRNADTVHRSPIRYVDATVDRLTLRGIRLKGFREGVFNVGELSIDSPKGSLVTRPVAPDTTKKSASFHLESIDIQRIELSDAALDWQQITTADTLIYRISDLDLTSETFRWRAGQGSEIGRLQGGAVKVEYTFQYGDYTLEINRLNLDFNASQLTADSLKLLPQHPKNRFMRLSAGHSDYSEATIAGLSCYGIDFQEILKEKTVRIDSLGIASGHFLSYKNRQLNYGQKVKPMIHTMIQKIPIPFEINTLSVNNFDAAYEELAMHGNAPGRVTFDDIEAVIRGTTNRVVLEEQYMEVYANAKLMDQSELRATISLPVDPANDHFEAKAVLHAMPFASLNPMVEPLAQVELNAGRIERLDFAMAGNSTAARVELTLRYSGLKVELVKEKHGAIRERHFLSTLVNRAVVKADNPDKNGLRTVSETVRRDPYRSAFNYLWKGISAGAMETAETGAAKKWLNK